MRLLDSQTGALAAARAHGSLLPRAREAIAIPEAALRRASLEGRPLPASASAGGRRASIFRRGGRGVTVPLVSAGHLVGAVDVEAPEGERAVGSAAPLWRLAPCIASVLRSMRLEAELSACKHRQEDLVERANALILVADGARRVRVFNQAFCRLSGRRREDVLGCDVLELVPEEDRRRLVRAVAATLRGETVEHLEVGVRMAEGRSARVSMNTAPLVSPDGAIDGVIAVGEDLTRFRELEGRVIQAEKLASVGRLAAGVVHELNNPLTSISVSAESLKSRFLTADSISGGDREKVDRILEATQRILRFTHDLLTYARPAPPEDSAIDVRNLVETAARFVDHVARDANAEIRLAIEDGLPPLRGVRQNLVQVLVNLLTNACQALDGRGTVEVAAFRETAGVGLRVRDDGRGIPGDELGRIFEPFFTTKPGGTGLGLAIVQGIVEKHGGSVEAQSEVGRGTSVTLHLPAEFATERQAER